LSKATYLKDQFRGLSMPNYDGIEDTLAVAFF
jgi:hypothetical protein